MPTRTAVKSPSEWVASFFKDFKSQHVIVSVVDRDVYLISPEWNIGAMRFPGHYYKWKLPERTSSVTSSARYHALASMLSQEENAASGGQNNMTRQEQRDFILHLLQDPCFMAMGILKEKVDHTLSKGRWITYTNISTYTSMRKLLARQPPQDYYSCVEFAEALRRACDKCDSCSSIPYKNLKESLSKRRDEIMSACHNPDSVQGQQFMRMKQKQYPQLGSLAAKKRKRK